MLSSEKVRVNANPVESGGIIPFIEKWGFPLIVDYKHDGERGWISKEQDSKMMAFNSHVSFYHEHTHKALFDKWRGLGTQFLIEGELCSENGGLYSYLADRNSGKDLIFKAFDILEYNNSQLRDRPLSYRKDLLQSKGIDNCIASIVHDPASLSQAIDEVIKTRGFEGVVIKSPKSRYGEDYWLKIKRETTIDAVITGIKKLDPLSAWDSHIPRSFRMALWDEATKQFGEFKYIGDVGTGLKIFEKQALGEILDTIKVGYDNDYDYVEPRFVLEITASGQTKDGKLIEPRIKRIRSDKGASDCKYKQMEALPIRN